MRSSVSIVIPTYNRAGTLREAIESARGQSHGQVEVIVVDDGSTDQTSSILDAYGDDIVAIRQENAGVSAARNAGVRTSTGSIIMFVDSDDIVLPDAAAEHASTFEAAGADTPCVMGDVVLRSPCGAEVSLFAERRLRPPHPRGRWLNAQGILTTRFLFTNQGLAIRRSAFDECGGFDEALWVMEDFDLALRLAALGPWAYTTAPVAVRNEGSVDGLTSAALADQQRFAAVVVDICSKAADQGTITQKSAQAGLDRMRRRAERANRRLAGTAHSLDQLVGFLDEEVGERVRRNVPWYPRIEGEPL